MKNTKKETKEKLSREPQNIDKHNWYYEEYSGITVVHEVIVKGKLVQTDQFKISWKKLLASCERKFL